jgi:cytochrome b pre-mRNA-processing protein 3
MKDEYLNIYNNLIKLTRNKSLYYSLKNNDTFSDRLVILLFHFAFFLKIYKKDLSKKDAQKLFDYFVRQIELSIREIGYGDVSVNKKMKDYVNLFYSILEKIDRWEDLEITSKNALVKNFINITDDNNKFVNYFDNYRLFLINNPLKIFTKVILETKF